MEKRLLGLGEGDKLVVHGKTWDIVNVWFGYDKTSAKFQLRHEGSGAWLDASIKYLEDYDFERVEG